MQQVDSKHIQGVSDVADHRCKHRGAPSRAVRLNRDRNENSFSENLSTDSPHITVSHFSSNKQDKDFISQMCCFDAAGYLRHGLKLAISVVNQIHQSADGSRGIKVVRQRLDHTGFGFGQPGRGHQTKFSQSAERDAEPWTAGCVTEANLTLTLAPSKLFRRARAV